ncbi:uncharacterized protein LOC142219888 [Haematobia irritans]|uniref:uncharacterized protein LOC142219888 n=1 Tax=Haematobia irritans TaxID=7368 RepID=UPI003F5098F1
MECLLYIVDIILGQGYYLVEPQLLLNVAWNSYLQFLHEYVVDLDMILKSLTGLFLIAFGFLATAQASKRDYALKCAHEEMGIRWPSYKSNAEYYVCHRVGERPMVMNCNPGEVFTFVLQVCTSPTKYIPAPALEILPTSSPLNGLHLPSHNNHHPDAFRPLEIVNRPPIFGEVNHQAVPPIMPEIPPMENEDIPKPPMVLIPNSDNNNNNKETEEVKENEVEAAVESVKPAPPMPPTPAPTPPVVDPNAAEESVKKPGMPKKPTAEKKKSSLKPTKSEKKKPTDTKDIKKSPKKPSKSPAKTPKKPAPAPKKSPKSPKKE